MANKFVRALLEAAPQICKFFEDGIVIFATDLSEFIMVAEHNFTIPGSGVGTKLQPGGPSTNAIKNQVVSTMELGASVYGAAMKVIAAPYFDDAEPETVIGTYGVAFPRDKAYQMREMAESFHGSLTEISAAMQKTAASAGEISVNEAALNKEILGIRNLASIIFNVLDDIKTIAGSTKMLGLNAAIEAARAGESGRGFGVVAEEIRKLAEISREAASRIGDLTKEIEQSINLTIKNSTGTVKASEDLATAVEEVNASLQEITSLTHELAILAKEQ